MGAADLRLDPTRIGLPESGIFIRCKGLDERWGAYDIAHLDLPSLRAWLREKSGRENVWNENIIALLLGHKVYNDAEPQP